MGTALRTLLLTLAALAWLAAPRHAHADSASLLVQAQQAKPLRYEYSITQGAEVRATSDNRAFTVWWQPSGGSVPDGVIVALHGHDSWAFDEFYLWHPYAQARGLAFLALQWWFGAGETTADYYTPDAMYPLIAKLLADKGVRSGRVMLVGFSRGSANSYAVAALDHAPSGQRYFGLVLSNAGGAIANYPPNQAIAAGTYGPLPFAGLPWAMYCGEKDTEPESSGCSAMIAARAWVTLYGADVVLFIDDPEGDHGGFMNNSANVESALATYAEVLAAPPPPTAVSGAEADCLFAWGEDHYRAELSPPRPPTRTLAPYTYRYYGVSASYLGVSSADDHLWYVDASGHFKDLGLAAAWSAQAGCR